MEHYSNIARKSRFNFDASLELRDYGAAALSATASASGIDTGIKLDKHEHYKFVVFHAAVSPYTAGSAYWTAALQVSADDSTYHTVASIALKDTAAQVEVPVSGFTVGHFVANASYARVTFTKTGSPGNLTAGAYLAVS